MTLETSAGVSVAEDTLRGVPAIAEFTGLSERVVYYRCATGLLPAIKVGDTWEMRKSTYKRHVERLEAEALARAANPAVGTDRKAFGRGRRRTAAGGN